MPAFAVCLCLAVCWVYGPVPCAHNDGCNRNHHRPVATVVAAVCLQVLRVCMDVSWAGIMLCRGSAYFARGSSTALFCLVSGSQLRSVLCSAIGCQTAVLGAATLHVGLHVCYLRAAQQPAKAACAGRCWCCWLLFDVPQGCGATLWSPKRSMGATPHSCCCLDNYCLACYSVLLYDACSQGLQTHNTV